MLFYIVCRMQGRDQQLAHLPHMGQCGLVLIRTTSLLLPSLPPSLLRFSLSLDPLRTAPPPLFPLAYVRVGVCACMECKGQYAYDLSHAVGLYTSFVPCGHIMPVGGLFIQPRDYSHQPRLKILNSYRYLQTAGDGVLWHGTQCLRGDPVMEEK